MLNNEIRQNQLETVMRLLRESTRLYQLLEVDSGDIFRGNGLYLEYMKLNAHINSVYKRLYPHGDMVATIRFENDLNADTAGTPTAELA